MKSPHPPLADEGIIPQQSTFLVLHVLRVKRLLSFHIHPLEVFEEAKLITFSDTAFELADALRLRTVPAGVSTRLNSIYLPFRRMKHLLFSPQGPLKYLLVLVCRMNISGSGFQLLKINAI